MVKPPHKKFKKIKSTTHVWSAIARQLSNVTSRARADVWPGMTNIFMVPTSCKSPDPYQPVNSDRITKTLIIIFHKGTLKTVTFCIDILLQFLSF